MITFAVTINSALRLIGLFSLLWIAGCSSVPGKEKIPVANATQQIYFIYREWHTSILLPAEAVRSHSRFMKESAIDQQYIRVGWGDGVYFTGKSKTVGSATKALFISQYSALQVLAYSQSPFTQIPEGTIVPLAITSKGLRELIHYIDDSFEQDNHQLIPLPAYAEGTGSFYRAKGRYGLFSNCNTWSGRALQAAGLPVRSSFRLTAQSVFEQAKAISSYQLVQGTFQLVEGALPAAE